MRVVESDVRVVESEKTEDEWKPRVRLSYQMADAMDIG